MTENPDQSTNLKPRYAARVAEDLERNTAEQERLAGEMAAIHEQLEALRQDHALLVRMQRALGHTDATQGQSAPTGDTRASLPRQAPASTGPSSKSKTGGAKKSAVKKTTPRARAAMTTRDSSSPTLRDLVVDHLSHNGEPLSALEVTGALATAHPERTVKVTVVRSTLEAMVAKGLVRRSKQGNSVFYSAGKK
ncbi:hypothetical protein ACHBTE_15930 [Streptomyces sp. M41]|uniref:hypothetical protein n=1 Tax=Streptomyces sp. M41 TaxID=3059412 RepID=UPI00374CC43C